MTVLAAQKTKDKIILGADKGAFYKNGFKKNGFNKIIKVNDLIFSFTGPIDELQIFELYASCRKPENNSILGITKFFIDFQKYCRLDLQIDNNFKVEGHYFLVFDKKLFHYNSSVKEIKENEFETDGAGFQEAYMCMFLGFDVKTAIEKTIECNIWTSGGVDIVEIDL